MDESSVADQIPPAKKRKGIILQNKIKSFGNHVQLEKYKNEGYNVAVLALSPETLDEKTKQST
jgi:hypothetical protein